MFIIVYQTTGDNPFNFQIMIKISFLFCIVFLFAHQSGVNAQKKIKFRTDGHFKIVQITDTHINLKSGKSEVSYELIDEVIQAEKPDLIVFTGDQVTEWNPQTAWKRLIKQMQASRIPWTMVFGNHDHEQGMTHDEIFNLVAACPNCLIEKGYVKGTGNFVLELDGAHTPEPAMILYFMDTHSNVELQGIGGYQWLDFSQISWYQEQSRKYQLPALAFLHIPLPEYNEVLNKTIFGTKNESVCSPHLNTGMFAAMKERGDVMGIFAGHDHENDYIGVLYDIALGYGRFSGGKCAYGNLSPGVRVINLTEGKREFDTYIRLKGGEILYPCKYPDSFKQK